MAGGTYQIVGDCAHVTVSSPTGPMVELRHKGALVSPDDPRLPHLLDAGLVVQVGGDVTGGLDASGRTEFEAAQDDPTPRRSYQRTDTTTAPATSGGEVKVPDGRAGKQAWVDYGAAQGRDRAALEALTLDDLRAELKPKG